VLQTTECVDLVIQIPQIIFFQIIWPAMAVLSAFKTLAIFVIARSTSSAMSVEDEVKK
jgi:hypothetical protein